MTYGGAPYGGIPYGGMPSGLAWPAAGASERVLLLSPRDSDLATLVASAQASTLPVGNLQTIQPQKKWRGTGVTAASITIALASPIACNALALAAHNLTPAAYLRVRGAATAAAVTASPIVDTSYQSAWPLGIKPAVASWPNYLSLVRWTNAAALQYWQLDISDPGPGQTYLEAGRLVIGATWQPTTNFDLGGYPLGFDSLDVQTKTPSGYIFTDRRAASAGRQIALQITGANQREVQDGIAEIQRLRGMWGDVIVCLDPAATTDFHRQSMQGVFTAKPRFPIVPQWDADGIQYGATLSLDELL